MRRNGAPQMTDDTQQQRTACVGEACLANQNIACQICRDACEVGAIRFSPQLGRVAQPVVDVEACTACSECLAVCPTGAISLAVQPEAAEA